MKDYLKNKKEEKGFVGIIILLFMFLIFIPIIIFVNIILVSVGILVASSADDVLEKEELNNISVNTISKEAETFNNKFKNYEGEVYGSSIKTLVSMVNKNNDGKEHIVKMFGTDISGSYQKGYTFNGELSNKYKIKTYKSKDGFINEISISKVNNNSNNTVDNTSKNNESLTDAFEKFIDAENRINDKSKEAIKKYENALNEADLYMNEMENRYEQFYYNATHR